jgi:hypothetical protein
LKDEMKQQKKDCDRELKELREEYEDEIKNLEE